VLLISCMSCPEGDGRSLYVLPQETIVCVEGSQTRKSGYTESYRI
jgi:hypothetical protein